MSLIGDLPLFVDPFLLFNSEVYEKASDATHPSLKAILYFSGNQLERVQAILRRLKLEKCPHLILIDARNDNKPSGSKA